MKPDQHAGFASSRQHDALTVLNRMAHGDVIVSDCSIFSRQDALVFSDKGLLPSQLEPTSDTQAFHDQVACSLVGNVPDAAQHCRRRYHYSPGPQMTKSLHRPELRSQTAALLKGSNCDLYQSLQTSLQVMFQPGSSITSLHAEAAAQYESTAFINLHMAASVSGTEQPTAVKAACAAYNQALCWSLTTGSVQRAMYHRASQSVPQICHFAHDMSASDAAKIMSLVDPLRDAKAAARLSNGV